MLKKEMIVMEDEGRSIFVLPIAQRRKNEKEKIRRARPFVVSFYKFFRCCYYYGVILCRPTYVANGNCGHQVENKFFVCMYMNDIRNVRNTVLLLLLYEERKQRNKNILCPMIAIYLYILLLQNKSLNNKRHKNSIYGYTLG
jgi:hypothetical protein